eukprot:m.29596 g.29596  ORF g.29596 m.29596 type:complete len:425 (-) comp6169_c0_seq1:2712-3986(-)
MDVDVNVGNGVDVVGDALQGGDVVGNDILQGAAEQGGHVYLVMILWSILIGLVGVYLFRVYCIDEPRKKRKNRLEQTQEDVYEKKKKEVEGKASIFRIKRVNAFHTQVEDIQTKAVINQEKREEKRKMELERIEKEYNIKHGYRLGEGPSEFELERERLQSESLEERKKIREAQNLAYLLSLQEDIAKEGHQDIHGDNNQDTRVTHTVQDKKKVKKPKLHIPTKEEQAVDREKRLHALQHTIDDIEEKAVENVEKRRKRKLQDIHTNMGNRLAEKWKGRGPLQHSIDKEEEEEEFRVSDQVSGEKKVEEKEMDAFTVPDWQTMKTAISFSDEPSCDNEDIMHIAFRIRLQGGKRENFTRKFTRATSIQELASFCASKGYPFEDFTYTLASPSVCLNEGCDSKTLKDIGVGASRRIVIHVAFKSL